jgi:hypothetical protein
MPRPSLPVAMTDEAPSQAPKQKRKRLAAGKIAGNTAPKRTKAKTKAARNVAAQPALTPLLALPAPQPLLLLTYVGPSRQAGSTAIAFDLPRPIKRGDATTFAHPEPSAAQIADPVPGLDDSVDHGARCGRLPAVLSNDTPAQAPKQTTAPKRKGKHAVARKTAGKQAHTQKTVKTKVSQHVPTPLSLPPAPQIHLPLLTGAGAQIGAGASAIDVEPAYTHLSAPRAVRAEPQGAEAACEDRFAPGGEDPASSSETFAEAPPGPAPSHVRRAYSIGSRIAATIGLTGAVVGAVLLLARPSPTNPTDAITQHDLIPAETALTPETAQPRLAQQDTAQQHMPQPVVGAQQDVDGQHDTGAQQHVGSDPEDIGTRPDLGTRHDVGAYQNVGVRQDIGAHQEPAAHQGIGAQADARVRPTAPQTAPAPPPAATEVKLTEVASLAGLAGVQPFTVAFSDHSDGQPADPVTGLIAFDNWAATKPVQKRFLSPFPGYTEKVLAAGADGDKKPAVEKLHMYVAEARFVIAKPAHAIDLTQYVNIGYLEGIDAAIKHRSIKPDEADNTANPNPARRWCEPQAGVLCIESRYQLEGKLPTAIRLLNQITNGKKIADYLEFQSELRVVPLAELDQKGLAKLTGLDTPVIGVLEETIFQVNQIMQFGKFLVLLQRDAADPNRTVATAIIALALKTRLIEKQKRFEDVPVLHNLVPAQVLTGRSSFNTGTSISAGLPLYARSNIKAVAATLERQ